MFSFLPGFLSEIDFFTLASLFVLLWMSVFSWSVLLAKYISYRKILRNTGDFTRVLESRSNYTELSEIAEKNFSFPAQKMYIYSMLELNRMKKLAGADAMLKGDVEASLERAVDLVLTKFQRESEKGLSYLASVSNAAPFIGLFGTVTGVLNTLYGLGAEQGAVAFNNIAPSLSVALVATAFGLFVAIPASMGFNFLKSRLGVIRLMLREAEISLFKRILS